MLLSVHCGYGIGIHRRGKAERSCGVRILPDTSDPRKYVKISENLEAQIVAGLLEPGEVVTISELVEEFKVARPTARQAMKLIEEKGLVARCGTIGFVVTRKCPICGQERRGGAG